MQRKTRYRLLRCFLRLLLLIAIIVATSPFWFPWLFHRLARSYGLNYATYQREGYGRFQLVGVGYTNNSVTFHADRLEALVPLNWIWHLYIAPTKRPFLQVTGWNAHFASADSTGNPLSFLRFPENTDSARMSSAFSTVQSTRSSLAILEHWIPHGLFEDGTVHFASNQILLPALKWDGTSVMARATSSEISQTATLIASIPPIQPWHATVQIEPMGATVNLDVTNQAAGLELKGLVLWQTNHLDATARFSSKGWLPEEATIDSEDFQIPTQALGLRDYPSVSGAIHGRWSKGQFALDMNGRTRPQITETNLPSFDFAVQASGSTNQIQISKATLRSPGLNLTLSSNILFRPPGKLLSRNAIIDLTADLSKQPWIPATGMITGLARFEPSNQPFPNVSLELSGKAIDLEGIEATNLEVQAGLVWPWLDIQRAEIKSKEGFEATLKAKANLKARDIASGVLHLEGPLESRYLQGFTCEHLLLHANFSGPLAELSHNGAIQLKGLASASIPPLGVEFEWHGRQTDISQFQGNVLASNSVIRVEGTALQKDRHLDAAIEQFTFQRNGEILYGSRHPFGITVEARSNPANAKLNQWLVVAEPFKLEGGQRSLELEAALQWPLQGAAKALIHSFRLVEFQDFVRRPLPGFAVESLLFSGNWTNGPVQFSMAGVVSSSDSRFAVTGAQFRLKGDRDGIAVQQLEIESQKARVISARGFLPLTLDPTNAGGIVQLRRHQKLQLHAITATNAPFWDRICAGLPLRMVDPNVQIDVTGPIESLAGRISARIAALQPLPLSTNRPLPHVEDLRAEIYLTGQAVKIDRLSAHVEGQELEVSAQIPTETDISTNWRRYFKWQNATGRLQIPQAQIAPFARFAPEYLSPEGDLTVSVTMQTNFQFHGHLELRGAATRPLLTLGTIQGIGGKIDLTGRKIQLETFSGLIGGEPFSVQGTIDFDQINPATGVPSINLKIKGNGISLARQPDLIIRSDLDLVIANRTNQVPVVSGSIHLRDSVILSELRELVPGKVAKPRSRPPYFSIDLPPFADWHLDLQVKGDRFLKIRSPFFRGELSTDLKIEGELKEPLASGELTISSGIVEFPFAALEVTQGLVSFNTSNRYHPEIFVTAGSRVFGYDVRMDITGTADQPIIRFSSTPPLSSEQVLLMVSAGEIPQAETAISTQQRASRLALFLGKNLLSELAPGGGATDRLTIKSGEYLSDQGQQTYSLEYRLSKHWSLIGEYDRFGDVNAGIKWRIYSR